MTFQAEFPDYPVADMPAIPAGFIDVSWHNDTCPCFEAPVAGYRLFVDYLCPLMREIPEGPRFSLLAYNKAGELDPMVETDDWSEIVKAVALFNAGGLFDQDARAQPDIFDAPRR